MRVRRMLIGIAVAAFFACPATVWGNTAAKAFANGESLLSKADFQGALRAYATAARAERDNPEYLQRHALVRQIITMRRRLDAEDDPQQWEHIARALHSFYLSEGIYREALVLDRQLHARKQSASTAIMLAETELAMNRNEEAAQTLASLDSGKVTAATRALLGVALARQGKVGEAKQIAREVVLPEKAGPLMTYTVARLHGASGDSAKALVLLTQCFQSLPPSRLVGFKAHAEACPDFARLASTADFAEVLQTESKVPESKCSGGSKCAGCPSRGKCPGSKGQ